MELAVIKNKLFEIGTIADEEWMKSLDDRKKNELTFHDLVRDGIHAESMKSADTYEKWYGNEKFYGGIGLSKKYIEEWIRGHAKNRIFLDYACGNGGYAVMAAKAGAELSIGIDISRISIENAKHKATQAGVQKNTYFLQADAENTKLPDGSIDAIVCSGMLHHLDLSYAFPELRRILSKDGKILAVEALDYNPAIKLYRRLTPKMRTEWEKTHILGFADLRFAKRFFRVGEIRYWHLTSILSPYMKSALPVLNFMDGFLTRVPLLQLMAWMFSFELLKK
ncbi:MAG: class I SAM-dependent methyltransferase [Desulfobacteraceae bacterium]|nr:MAG: class I SAM-dependent methyltransferase [Desulfobacteraceae bacterium]